LNNGKLVRSAIQRLKRHHGADIGIHRIHSHWGIPLPSHDHRPSQGGGKVWLHPLLANDDMMSEMAESSLKKRVNADVFSELTV
jgi:hypothetical protein